VTEHARAFSLAHALRTPRFLERPLAGLRSAPGTWTLVLCCVLGAIAFNKAGRQFAALKALRTQSAVLNDAYRRNLPIVQFDSNPRALNTAYSVHLRDKYLAQARHAPKGTLLDINDAVRKTRLLGRPTAYLVVDADVYGPQDMAALIEQDCAVVISRHGSGIQLSTSRKLRESCQAPGGAPPLPR
jgi:hypothetical protein